jgi:glutamate:GABA antiporter
MAGTISESLRVAEANNLAHSSALPKELGIGDLVFAQILLVVVPEFFGASVKAGPSHVVLWLLSVTFFFVPLALVVVYLNRRMPLEGGLYEWARLSFNDGIGFLTAWNIWLFIVLYFAMIGLVATTFLSYAMGPQAAWIASNKSIVLAISAGLIAGLVCVARLGLRVGKWVGNAGSGLTVLTICILIAVPTIQSWRGVLSGYHPLRLVMPTFTVFNLNVFSKMTFGALCGFEYVAIFAGECKSPGRNIARATAFALPIIVLLYILGTAAMLAYVAPESVDVIAPIPQALRVALHSYGFLSILVPISILLLLTNYISTFSVQFSGNARLPMVAGWDHLLPAWFTRLHAKHRTPVNSILFAGGITFAASIAVLIGVSEQEAFELLQVWSFTFYALTYLVLFAIPLLARKGTGIRPALWLRVTAASGFVLTLLFVLLSVVPIIDVRNPWEYALKTVSVVIGANLIGFMLYRLGARSQARAKI